MELIKVIEQLREIPGEFAQSLVYKHGRYGLSPKQEYWARKLVTDRNKPQETLSGFLPIVEFFAAVDKIKYPSITFVINDLKVKISRAGENSRYAGDLHVTDGGRYGENKYYGRIDQNGNLNLPRNTQQEQDRVNITLKSFALDPVNFASSYGKETGICCFCHADLTDDRSVQAGYGPVCAKNWGLPWGKQLDNAA